MPPRHPPTLEIRRPQAVPLVRHDFHGEWNYTIQPAAWTTTDGKVTKRAPKTVLLPAAA